jgi:hypothetical protein
MTKTVDPFDMTKTVDPFNFDNSCRSLWHD